MYYAEKWIDGILHKSLVPHTGWIPLTQRELNTRIIKRETELLSIHFDIKSKLIQMAMDDELPMDLNNLDLGSETGGLYVVYRTISKPHNEGHYAPSDLNYKDDYLIRNYEDAKAKYEEFIQMDDTYTAGIGKLVESTDHDPNGEI